MQAKRKNWVLAVAALCAGLAGAPVWATDVGGPILEDTIWDCAHSPYRVVNSIIIGNNATLTIEPCVEVRFRTGTELTIGHGTYGPGTLVARGTQQSRILFTSNQPYEPNQPPPHPGDWRRVYFTDYAVDAVFDPNDPNDPNAAYTSDCIMEYVTVEYAGGGGVSGAVMIENSEPYLSHCVIHDNASRGLYANGANVPKPLRIRDCELHHNTLNERGAGIYLTGGASSHWLQRNSIHDNAGAIYGAGIYTEVNAKFISNSVRDNVLTAQGYGGGGVFLNQLNGSTTLTGNIISGNTSNNGHGGGLYVYYGAGPNLINNTIAGNVVTGSNYVGAGVHIYRSSAGTMSSNTISGNVTQGSPSFGGGIYFNGSPNWTLTNNVITENASDGHGAGIYFNNSGNDPNRPLTGNSITSNNPNAPNRAGGVFITGSSQHISFAGDVLHGIYNTICENDGYEMWNDMPFDPTGVNDIDARNVRWCTDDSNEIQDGILDYFDDSTRAIILSFPFVHLHPGDMNCDGVVNFDDINPFVLALSDEEGYEAAYPHCCCENADCNGDGVVDFADINPFVALLSGL